MHGIVYFLEDASVSVISKKDKRILTADLAWKEKESLEMRWDGLIYKGIIVKTGEDRSELKELGDLIAEDVLQHLEGVPVEVPEEIYTINLESSGGKRKRKPTEKLIESRKPGVQEEEPSPKKKSEPKKKKTTAKNDKVLETQTALKRRQEKKKTEEAACLNEENEMMELLKSPMYSQFQDTSSVASNDSSPSLHSQHSIPKMQHLPDTSATQQTPVPKQHEQESIQTPTSTVTGTFQKTTAMAPSNNHNLVQTPAPQHTNIPTTTTSMTETWGLVQEVQNLQDIQRCQFCTMPAPPQEFIKLLECISAINENNVARQFMGEFINHFGITRNAELKHNFLCETSNYDYNYMPPNSETIKGDDSTDFEETPLIPILRRSPRKHERMMQPSDSEPTFTTLKTPKKTTSSLRKQLTQSDPDPMNTIYGTPNQKDNGSQELDASCERYSPVVNESIENMIEDTCNSKDQGKKTNSARNDKSVTRMRPLVKHRPDILVDEIKLNRCSKVAKSHKNPGYAMTMKLMPLLFSDFEMAMSRGQGLAPPVKGDFRPALDQERVTTLREYIPAWCSISNTQPPSDKDMNKAITEAVSYARKKINKKGSSDAKQCSE